MVMGKRKRREGKGGMVHRYRRDGSQVQEGRRGGKVKKIGRVGESKSGKAYRKNDTGGMLIQGQITGKR